MWKDIEALIPPFLMLVVFIAVAVAAFRATDGARRRPGNDADR